MLVTQEIPRETACTRGLKGTLRSLPRHSVLAGWVFGQKSLFQGIRQFARSDFPPPKGASRNVRDSREILIHFSIPDK